MFGSLSLDGVACIACAVLLVVRRVVRCVGTMRVFFGVVGAGIVYAYAYCFDVSRWCWY